jgi:hypothetical protein
MSSAETPQWVFILLPKPSNGIYDTLKGINKQTLALGWAKKFADLTFLGASHTDLPMKNMIDREKLMRGIDYAMKKTIKVGEDIPFRVIEGVTPMVSEAGMGLILESPFLKYLSDALGFKTHDMFFLVLSAAPPGKKWSEETVRAGVRMIEDPEDGQFHCSMNPSQWSIGVINTKNTDMIYALYDLENVIAESYIKIEMERQLGSSGMTMSEPDFDKLKKLTSDTVMDDFTISMPAFPKKPSL